MGFLCHQNAGPAASHYKSQYSRGRCWYKGKWFIFRCQPPGRQGAHVSCPSPDKMGDSHLKAHLHLSVEAQAFIGGREEQNKEIKGYVEKVPMWRLAQPMLVFMGRTKGGEGKSWQGSSESKYNGGTIEGQAMRSLHVSVSEASFISDTVSKTSY